MNQKIWINKALSFSEANKFDDSYYLSLSASERIETMQFLREEYRKIKKGCDHESGKRLPRVFKIIKQA
jgi:hypothetical protein